MHTCSCVETLHCTLMSLVPFQHSRSPPTCSLLQLPFAAAICRVVQSQHVKKRSGLLAWAGSNLLMSSDDFGLRVCSSTFRCPFLPTFSVFTLVPLLLGKALWLTYFSVYCLRSRLLSLLHDTSETQASTKSSVERGVLLPCPSLLILSTSFGPLLGSQPGSFLLAFPTLAPQMANFIFLSFFIKS